MRNTGYPALLNKPPGQSVLVLSPHPDDEVIGCGGVLVKHIVAEDAVKIVYMTDGSKGYPGNGSPEDLVSVRKLEAVRARNILGIKDFVHLDFPDGELRVGDETVNAIYKELEESKADIIYVPSFFETHPDHSTTPKILFKALKRYAKNPSIYAYEVWAPLAPTIIVDISESIALKREAIKQFETQRAEVDILDIFEGMAKYRAFIHLGKQGYAECFFSCSSKEYLKLWNLLS
jgi:LmbE family N-acetylglucosaminyl deacetylase